MARAGVGDAGGSRAEETESCEKVLAVAFPRCELYEFRVQIAADRGIVPTGPIAPQALPDALNRTLRRDVLV